MRGEVKRLKQSGKWRICAIFAPQPSMDSTTTVASTLHLLEPLAEELFAITSNFPEDAISSEQIHIINIEIKESARSSMWIRIPRFVILQLKISYHLYSIRSRIDIIFLAAGSSTLVLPALLARLMRKRIISLYPGQDALQKTADLGELYCNFFYNYYGLPVAIARYFNVYGPGEIPGAYRNVIPNFTYWALHRRKLPITGTGEETRDFTFVEDIVDGTLRLGVIPEAVGDAFNLASETETRVIDIANMVNKIAGNPSGVEFIPRRDWDKITRRRASIEKAKKVLGYKPKMKIETGVKKVYNWITENRERIEASARF